MPELPEVEIMSRNLQRWVGGRKVEHLEVVDPRVVAGGDPRLSIGLKVCSAWRRGKYAILDLGDKGHLVFHFRMTGKVVPRRPTGRARLWLRAGDREIAFEDARCLGQIWWQSVGSLDAFFAARGLGPEPWPGAKEGEWWSARLQGLRGPIKPALMRQERVAGIGNILASEACWRASVSPMRPVPEVSEAQWSALAGAVHETIEHTLAAESGDEIVYVNQGGEGSFSVYGRLGKPCARCGASIERMMQSGRATYWCPACQPLS